MSKETSGGPAFPCPDGNWTDGMSLRDWFAGRALAGYMAIKDERSCPKERRQDLEAWRNEVLSDDAMFMYRMADAMLKARSS